MIRDPMSVHQPHHLQNPKWLLGGPKMADGSGKVSTHRFLGTPVNFRQISFLMPTLPFMRKDRKGEKNKNETYNRSARVQVQIILKYFLTTSKKFSWSTLLYFGLSWSISVYLRLSLTIFDYLRLHQTISEYLGL